MNHSAQIIQTLSKILNENVCRVLCTRSGFIERASSKLEGHEFIKAMILPCMGSSMDSLSGLCKRLREINPDADLSAQALCERINHVSAATLMQEVFTQILCHIQTKTSVPCEKLSVLLKSFRRVLLGDSTVITLNERLKTQYPGTNRGGRGSKAQIKIDVVYDIIHGKTVNAEICEGNLPDQGLAGRVLCCLKAGDLLIRDLGFFVLATLKAISNNGSYFLSRFLPHVKVYLNSDSEQPIELSSYLHKRFARYSIIELKVYLGEERVPCRMVLYRQPKEVVDKRLMEANKRAKETGRTMSKSKLFCMRFAIFVTNADENLLSVEMIGSIYRLRWEIELVFKRWKSQLEIDYLKGININRIECLVWSRLSSILITEIMRGAIERMLPKGVNVELSDTKCISYLLRGSRFFYAVIKDKLGEFFRELKKDVRRMLLKNKRSRTTLRERIFIGESYYGMKTSNIQVGGLA